jgi:hypothetical protein
MKPLFTSGYLRYPVAALLLSFFLPPSAVIQLGTFQFTGFLITWCTNTNSSVNARPANTKFGTNTIACNARIASLTNFNIINYV